MTKQYHEYSALDAPEYLLNVLRYLFTSDNSKYKFTKTKLAYIDICKHNKFSTALTNFDIITGTDLITNKMVTSYKSAQCRQYLIRKDYYQNFQQMLRTEKRTQAKDHKPTSTPKKQHTKRGSTKKSPFIQDISDL